MKVLMPVELRYAVREADHRRTRLAELLDELALWAQAHGVSEEALRELLVSAIARAREDA